MWLGNYTNYYTWRAQDIPWHINSKNILVVVKLFFLTLCCPHVCACAKLLHSCPTLCDPMDRSPPGFSVRGISQARILPFRWERWGWQNGSGRWWEARKVFVRQLCMVINRNLIALTAMAQVKSLVGDLTSHRPCGTAQNERKRKKEWRPHIFHSNYKSNSKW